MVAAERGRWLRYWRPDAEFSWSGGGGVANRFLRGMYQDIEDGVRGRVTNVLASREVVVCEIDLINPPEAPFHCPPAVVWIQHLEAGRTSRLRFFHPPRSVQPIPA